MSASDAIYFDGRALSVNLDADDLADSGPAQHVASLVSAIEQVSAVGQSIATDTSDPQVPARLHGLLVAIELMASFCGLIAEGVSESSGKD